jgi:hypothetical protein
MNSMLNLFTCYQNSYLPIKQPSIDSLTLLKRKFHELFSYVKVIDDGFFRIFKVKNSLILTSTEYF